LFEVGEMDFMLAKARPTRSARLKLRKWRALKINGLKIVERDEGLTGAMEVVIAGKRACRVTVR
jgi:hypothetical protein